MSALARIRASDVLPVPRGPTNRTAWLTRSARTRVAQRLDDRILADDLGEGLGSPAAIQRLVRDRVRHHHLPSMASKVEVPCTLRRPGRPRAHHDGRLGPGRSAAPGDDRLVLLPSGPDTVRGSPLRGTRSSTSHRRAAFGSGDLGRGFSPAGADCRYRAPLVPRLARLGKDNRERRRGWRTTPASATLRGAQRGGEGGIRTRDGLPQTAFPVRRHSPLGDLSPKGASLHGRSVPDRRSGGRGQGGEEHENERTRRCVSERADAPTPASAEPGERLVAERAGFEPAVLSHTAFRERHHQPLGHLSAGEDTKHAPSDPWARRVSAPATVSNRAAASSRRMPLTTLIRRGKRGVLGELDDRPGRAVAVVRQREHEGLDVALRAAPRRTSRRAPGWRRSSRRPVASAPSLRAASRRATTTAWAVGSFVSWTRSWARATIASSTTATAAIGSLALLERELRLGERLAHEQLVVHGSMLADGPSRRRSGSPIPVRNRPSRRGVAVAFTRHDCHQTNRDPDRRRRRPGPQRRHQERRLSGDRARATTSSGIRRGWEGLTHVQPGADARPGLPATARPDEHPDDRPDRRHDPAHVADEPAQDAGGRAAAAG